MRPLSLRHLIRNPNFWVIPFWVSAMTIFISLCWFIGKHQEDIRERDARIAMQALIQTSGSANPTNYFEQISKSWSKLSSIRHDIGYKETLKVEPTNKGQFVLGVSGQLPPAIGGDLGIAAYRVATKAICALVWGSGEQITNVDKISVRFFPPIRVLLQSTRLNLSPIVHLQGSGQSLQTWHWEVL